MANRTHAHDDDSYFAQRLIETRQRRLFTFVHPVLIQRTDGVDGDHTPFTTLIVAAMGMVEEENDTDLFLVLDRVYYDLEHRTPAVLETQIGVWMLKANVASAQINIIPAGGPRSIRDVKTGKAVRR
jgi:hypothetical protein